MRMADLQLCARGGKIPHTAKAATRNAAATRTDGRQVPLPFRCRIRKKEAGFFRVSISLPHPDPCRTMCRTIRSYRRSAFSHGGLLHTHRCETNAVAIELASSTGRNDHTTAHNEGTARLMAAFALPPFQSFEEVSFFSSEGGLHHS